MATRYAQFKKNAEGVNARVDHTLRRLRSLTVARSDIDWKFNSLRMQTEQADCLPLLETIAELDRIDAEIDRALMTGKAR